MHEPMHNDYSTITEVIKTSADRYQHRQSEWRDNTARGQKRNQTRAVLTPKQSCCL